MLRQYLLWEGRTKVVNNWQLRFVKYEFKKRRMKGCTLLPGFSSRRRGGSKVQLNNCIQTPLFCVIVPTWDSLFRPSSSPPPPPLPPPSQPYHNTIRNLIALALVKVEGIFSDDKSDFD